MSTGGSAPRSRTRTYDSNSSSTFTAEALDAIRLELFKAQKDAPFFVFLCGPSLKDKKNRGAKVRKKLHQRLTKHGINVVLGEDDGLENLRKKFSLNAQDNELQFITKTCDAIVIVAASVGSFCELGLFSWHHSNSDGLLHQSQDLIVIIERKFSGSRYRKSYLQEGPAKAANGFGMVDFMDFRSADIEKVISRILERRSARIQDRRGRPVKRGREKS